jgi:hypothetical protein
VLVNHFAGHKFHETPSFSLVDEGANKCVRERPEQIFEFGLALIPGHYFVDAVKTLVPHAEELTAPDLVV